jgi:hypothetical protein
LTGAISFLEYSFRYYLLDARADWRIRRALFTKDRRGEAAAVGSEVTYRPLQRLRSKIGQGRELFLSRWLVCMVSAIINSLIA